MNKRMIKEAIIRWLGLDERYKSTESEFKRQRSIYDAKMNISLLVDKRFDVLLAKFIGQAHEEMVHSLTQKRLADIVDTEQFLDNVVARLKAKQL